jgi:DNA invertase Pin-like site-specific DNA recombinase
MAKNSLRQSLAPRYVSYLRVSRESQGINGLGIEAQRRAVHEYLKRMNARDALLAEYVEVESGKRSDRPQLNRAIDHSRNARATLVIAKLDRLSRDVHFLTGLERAGIEFVACDLPNANRLTITILAAVAEHEREMISQRTKAALAVARDRVSLVGQRGRPDIKRLGNPNGSKHLVRHGNASAILAVKARADERAMQLKPALDAIEKTGLSSARAIARALNEQGVLSPRDSKWEARTVINLQMRLRLLLPQKF